MHSRAQSVCMRVHESPMETNGRCTYRQKGEYIHHSVWKKASTEQNGMHTGINAGLQMPVATALNKL